MSTPRKVALVTGLVKEQVLVVNGGRTL